MAPQYLFERPILNANGGIKNAGSSYQLFAYCLYPFTPEVTPEVSVLSALKGEMSRQALQAALGLRDSEHFRKAYLLPALKAGLIEMTIPDKPRSRLQEYRATAKGLDVLRKCGEPRNAGADGR